MPGINNNRHVEVDRITVKYDGFATSDPKSLPELTEDDLKEYKTYEDEVIIYNQYNQIVARVYKRRVDSKDNGNIVAAIKALLLHCTPITSDDSLHHGVWRESNDFIAKTREQEQAIKYYNDTKYPPLWKNRSMRRLCDIVDGRFSAMTKKSGAFKRYCALKAPRYYTKSFVMCVINQGGTTPHYDQKDEPEGYCCVVPLGSFTGGDLIFREHKIRLSIGAGDVVFFHSRNILHENWKIDGDRYSLVFTTHHNCFTEWGQELHNYYAWKQKPIASHKKLALLSEEEIEKRKAAAQTKEHKKKFKRATTRKKEVNK